MKSKVILFLSSILLFVTISTPAIQAQEIDSVNLSKDFVVGTDEELNIQDGDKIFDILFAIEQIPEDVLYQGIEATAKWIEEDTGLEVAIENGNLVFPELSNDNGDGRDFQFDDSTIGTYGLLNCISVVGLTIAGNGLPFTKIFKLKKAISLLGGVTSAVKKIQTKYKKYRSENWRMKPAFERAVKDVSTTLPKETQDAFLDFFGITAVITACSNLDS